ncbi:MAG: hypothetical protein RIB93_31715 [Coleofasciculus sp. D1-CHI-01]
MASPERSPFRALGFAQSRQAAEAQLEAALTAAQPSVSLPHLS